jgi:hypothetical protein
MEGTAILSQYSNGKVSLSGVSQPAQVNIMIQAFERVPEVHLVSSAI